MKRWFPPSLFFFFPFPLPPSLFCSARVERLTEFAPPLLFFFFSSSSFFSYPEKPSGAGTQSFFFPPFLPVLRPFWSAGPECCRPEAVGFFFPLLSFSLFSEPQVIEGQRVFTFFFLRCPFSEKKKKS